MFISILEAQVAPEKRAALEEAFKGIVGHMPPGMEQIFLTNSTTEPTLWRMMAMWTSREAAEAIRFGPQTPGGILMFRGVGAEPTWNLFEVVGHSTASSH